MHLLLPICSFEDLWRQQNAYYNFCVTSALYSLETLLLFSLQPFDFIALDVVLNVAFCHLYWGLHVMSSHSRWKLASRIGVLTLELTDQGFDEARSNVNMTISPSQGWLSLPALFNVFWCRIYSGDKSLMWRMVKFLYEIKRAWNQRS